MNRGRLGERRLRPWLLGAVAVLIAVALAVVASNRSSSEDEGAPERASQEGRGHADDGDHRSANQRDGHKQDKGHRKEHKDKKGHGDHAGPHSDAGAGGRIAPFTVTSIDGRSVRLPAGRPGALFFTSSACEACVASARALNDLKSSVGDRADVLLLGGPGESQEHLREFSEMAGNLTYPLAVDSQGTQFAAYKINALGTTLIYDEHGRITTRKIEPDSSTITAAFREVGVE